MGSCIRTHVSRTHSRISRASTVLLLAGLAGCGDSDSSAVVAPPGTPPSAQRDAFPGISAALTIDPANLPEYAAPVLPRHIASITANFDNTPTTNRLTNTGATLGRVLFFDRQLSINGTTSCASCHLASAGLSDTARFSTGFAGVRNTRAKSMRLFNLKYFEPGTAFWDRRASSLEDLATQPIRDSVELGFTAAVGGIDSLLRRMRALPYYPELFTIAFGDDDITEPRIRLALAQYLRSLISRDSRFDRALAATGGTNASVPFPDFSSEENRGKFLFMTVRPNGGLQCFECHAGPTFTLTNTSRSNGLDSNETRVFRAPSLKGVASARHFMHDGRFSTLEEVVEFYNSGVQHSPSLDQRLLDQNLVPRRLGMTESDKAAVVAFLKTLTDESTPFETRFSSPFKR
jgi:cytochrome c peroxidase